MLTLKVTHRVHWNINRTALRAYRNVTLTLSYVINWKYRHTSTRKTPLALSLTTLLNLNQNFKIQTITTAKLSHPSPSSMPPASFPPHYRKKLKLLTIKPHSCTVPSYNPCKRHRSAPSLVPSTPYPHYSLPPKPLPESVFLLAARSPSPLYWTLEWAPCPP